MGSDPIVSPLYPHIDVLMGKNGNGITTYDLFRASKIEQKFYFNIFVKQTYNADASDVLKEANDAFSESLSRVIHGK